MIDIPDIQKDIQLTKNRIKELQHLTVECVSFSPSGKVTVADKDRLEGLNSEIGRLAALVIGNETTLARLQEITGGVTLADLRLKRDKSEQFISKTKSLLRHDLGELLKRSSNIDPANPSADPRYAKLQSDAQAIINKETPVLERLTVLLTQADEILAGYLPSGLKEAVPQYTPFVGGF